MAYKNSFAVVTGGASGFGYGIAAAFAARGANVVIADINDDLGTKAAEELKTSFVHCDVSDNDSVSALIDGQQKIDIFVNNAGVTHFPMPAEEVEEDEFERVFQTSCEFQTSLNEFLVLWEQKSPQYHPPQKFQYHPSIIPIHYYNTTPLGRIPGAS